MSMWKLNCGSRTFVVSCKFCFRFVKFNYLLFVRKVNIQILSGRIWKQMWKKKDKDGHVVWTHTYKWWIFVLLDFLTWTLSSKILQLCNNNLLWRFKISFLSSCLKIEFCILDLEFWNTCYTNGTILFSTQFSSAQFSNVKTFFHFSHTTADNNLLSLLTSFRLFRFRQLTTYGKMVHIREKFQF